jgi:hypothetical protein
MNALFIVPQTIGRPGDQKGQVFSRAFRPIYFGIELNTIPHSNADDFFFIPNCPGTILFAGEETKAKKKKGS